MITTEFKEAYKRLNKEQKEAVDTIEGPVMVVAGPGTGKTTILALRIANILLQTDTPASGILALTFSEAGAKAMRLKLRTIIGTRADEVRIHTFHGFASSIIREFEDHFPHLARSKQMTEVEAESLMRTILKERKFAPLRPLGEPEFYIQKILNTMSTCRQEAWTPEMVESFAKEEIERIKNDEASISTRGTSKGKLKAESLKRIEKCERTIIFARVYKKYEEDKVGKRKIDFDDLIFELLQTMRKDELLLQLLQEKFLYILVDEHQDTNGSQNLIVKIISDFFENPNLFVVGDEKQAIYRFQGASIENFLQFQNKWSSMKVINLTQNYRSHQKILDASFSMIERNYTEDELAKLRAPLKSNARGHRTIELQVATERATEEAFLLERLKKIVEKEPNKQIAIIVRKNRDVARLLALCQTNGLEASAERGVDIFSHPVGVLFFSLIQFLSDPSQTESLATTIGSGLWDLDFAERIELIKRLRSGDHKETEQMIPELKELFKNRLELSATSYLLLTVEKSGLTKKLLDDPQSTEVWRNIYKLAENIATENNLNDARELMQALLDYKKSADYRLIKIISGNTNARVSIMTAHGSKGLEFDYVFLPFSIEEVWLSKKRGTYFILPREKEVEDEIRDERRLFYVALTRARSHATISYAVRDGDGSTQTELRFIEELGKEHLTRIQIPKTEILPKAENQTDRENRKVREAIQYTERTLLENGLSVTALNHFLDCPNKFFYKSILRLPEPRSPSSEKGNAMHEAISNVWHLTPNPSPRNRRGEKEITKTMISSINEYFKYSPLSKIDKGVVLEELVASAPTVAHSLLEHFSETGKVSTESWVDTHFEKKFKKETITLRLHGKLDAIIEKDKEVLVFDYKTREAMSVNAIKGETKNEDGNYFRQLIFYKMLLADKPMYKEKIILPALVFVKPDRKGRCPTIGVPIEQSDIERVRSEIASLIESVWSGSLFSSLCGDYSCAYCAYRKLL
ncbi:MAG: ATP-dependent DNA helicase [Patescibacteria group bacterium]